MYLGHVALRRQRNCPEQDFPTADTREAGANSGTRANGADRKSEKGVPTLFLADFTLGNLLVAMIAFFFLFLAVWMFIAVFADIFTRRDLSGWGKAGWVLLIFIIPLFGILIYLIARPSDVEARGMFSKD